MPAQDRQGAPPDDGFRELFRLEGDVPPPPVELLDWPDPAPVLPVQLYRLPEDREETLRGVLPIPEATAWDTAHSLTEWVSRQWNHANDHVERYDAVEILARAKDGGRFACDEYTVVLAQALNAVGIPARWLGLFRRDHHAGVGAAHSVAEAWIDELRRWVVLDGQNGAYWADADGTPFGVVELQRAFHAGLDRPRLVGATGPAADDDFWWLYFATAQTTGVSSPPASDLSWGPRTFGPVFQERLLLGTNRLLRKADAAYPDLSSVWIGIGGTREQPELTFGTDHPYACGFAVTDHRGRADVAIEDTGWALDLSAGEHDAQISLRTPYVHLDAGQVRYRIAHPPPT
ncbi:MAG TPA: transglutaminase-like domain-containing protein [Actinopolymorphaceae bacterium]|nr:transglutaminase-like domain-containing protein [Actinopolymorphaceae bacterium]